MEMSQWVEIPGAEALGAEGEVEHQGDYFAVKVYRKRTQHILNLIVIDFLSSGKTGAQGPKKCLLQDNPLP